MIGVWSCVVVCWICGVDRYRWITEIVALIGVVLNILLIIKYFVAMFSFLCVMYCPPPFNFCGTDEWKQCWIGIVVGRGLRACLVILLFLLSRGKRCIIFLIIKNRDIINCTFTNYLDIEIELIRIYRIKILFLTPTGPGHHRYIPVPKKELCTWISQKYPKTILDS